jgi:photosystem II stability/assembly factor-like uncharacterized protein
MATSIKPAALALLLALLLLAAPTGAAAQRGALAAAGSTWTAQQPPLSSGKTPVLYDLTAVSPQVAWAAGSKSVANDSLASEVIKTTDGGATWFIQWQPGSCCEVRSIVAASPTDLWLIRTGLNNRYEVLRSTDGGTTFNFQTSAPTPLWAVAAGSASAAWVVGTGGRILVTGDAGRFWIDRSYPTSASLWATAAASPEVGWAVGDDGTILNTRDGGSTWVAQPSGVSTALLGVAAASPRTAWAVGSDGVILKTTDGGDRWTAERSPIVADLIGVTAASESVAWAMSAVEGGVTTIVGTTDGGATWRTQYQDAGLSNPRRLGGIWAVSPYAAWAVSTGQILALGPSYPGAKREYVPLMPHQFTNP